MNEVRIYGRPGCHLCEEAKAMLIELRAEGRRLDLVEIDIEEDEDLFRDYLEKIPVIEFRGQIVSELLPNLDALRSSLDTVGT